MSAFAASATAGAQSPSVADPSAPSPPAVVAATAAPSAPSATVAPESVPAVGRQRAIVTVPEFGRYALELTSPAGAGLRVVDRMAGVLADDGAAGGRDGRLDLLLDRGEYRLEIDSPEPPAGVAAAGRGRVAVRVTPSSERQPEPLELVELETASTTLGDHEQASWWFATAERGAVFLEAAGRHLADLRLFREGRWLEDGEPLCAPRQPVVARPLADCRLDLELEPGLYRVTAFGGPGLPWSDGADERPLHVRRGLRQLPEAGRERFRMGPFGTERFLVASVADFHRLELARPGSARLRVGKLRGAAPLFSGAQATAWIGKRIVPPVAELIAPDTDPEPFDEGFALEPPSEAEEAETEEAVEVEASLEDEAVYEEEYDEASDEGYEEEWTEEEEVESAEEEAIPDTGLRWVEVAAAPGQEFVLQQFERRWHYAVAGPGSYWISVLQGAHAADEAEVTAVLVRLRRDAEDRDQVIVETAPRVALDRPWAARFNLRGETTLLVRVVAVGKYEARTAGVETRVRIEPFFTAPPRDYRVPDWKSSGKTWDLDAGLHVLTLEGGRAGVVDVALTAPGGGAAALAGLVGRAGAPPAPPTDRAPGRLGAVTLEADTSYGVWVGRRPGVETGILVRELPLDPARALPLVVLPGERLTLPVRLVEAGRLVAVGEETAPLALVADGGATGAALDLAAGEHALAVENRGAAVAAAALSFTPGAALAAPPVRPLPPEALAALPEFPLLTDAAPLAADLERGGTATFAVSASRPALYRLESTGLLALEGRLRTRTTPVLEAASQNGAGRNFRLERFLREGDYQLTVEALGRSAGHLGVRLEHAELASGGRVRPGEVARLAFESGQGARFEVEVERRSSLRIRGLGPGFTAVGRLDDADGWPVVEPSSTADWSVELEPGVYPVTLVPQGDATRALLVVEEMAAPERVEGHEPVELALGRAHLHRWLESAEGAPRAPDVYRFTLPAAATVAVALDAEMQGALLGPAGGGEPTLPNAPVEPIDPVVPILVGPGRSFERELAPGTWRLEVVCSRRNHRVDYTVEVSTRELVAGVEREFAAPAEPTVAVGEAPLLWIDSWATAPVRATLLDGTGRAVASGATRPDDWSFHLGARLAPGRYRLRIEPLTGDGANVRVALAAPEEALESAWDGVSRRDLELAGRVRLVPIASREGSGLVVVELRGDAGVELALEASDGADSARWRALASSAGHAPVVAALPPAAGDLRLRIAALDRGLERVELRGTRLAPRPRAERELERGVRLETARGLPAGLGAARIRLESPGALRLRSSAGEVAWASAPGAAPRPLGDAPVVALGEDLWLLGPTGTEVRGARERLAPGGAPLRLRLGVEERGALDLATSAAAGSGATGSGLTWATAASGTGVPWLRFAAGADGADGADAAGATAVEPNGAVAATLAADARRLELGDGDGAAAEIDVRSRRVPLGAARAVGFGSAAGRVEPSSAAVLALPPGRKLVRLALGGGVAAVAADGAIARAVHWSASPLAEETVTDASTLVLATTGASEAPYAVEILPAPPGAPDRLEPGAALEIVFPAAGRRRLEVEAPTGALRLRARGDEVELVLVEPHGAVRRGRELVTLAGGVLTVEHGPGAALVWTEVEGGGSPLLARPATPLAVTAPAAVPLTGGAVDLRVAVPGEGVLEIAVSAPVVEIDPERGERVELHARGLRRATRVGAEGMRLRLHGVGGAPLAGALELSWAPVETVGEGLGAPLALAPGAARFVAFEVPSARRIGVGVRADSAAVEATLYDAAGRPLGTGVVQRHELAAGRYLLALRLPAGSEPAVARPAVVGLERPPTTPPEEILRGYLAGDGAEPAPEESVE